MITLARTLGLALILACAACSQVTESDPGPGAFMQEGPPRPSVPGFSKLVLNSDFDGPLDATVWRVREDAEGAVLYQAARVSAGNGVLRLEGAPRPFRIGKYYGGGLVAEGIKVGPGRLVEFRMRVAGAARWNLAGWTFGGDPWPENGEIDTVELISRGAGRAFPLQSVHGPSRGLLGNNDRANLELDGAVWRTYASVWRGDTVTFYIDGKQSFQHRLTSSADRAAFKSFYPMISFYSGGWVGNARGPAWGYVDFVRVWEP